MAKIIIPPKRMGNLELQINGKDITIQFPVDSIAGYRQTTDVIKAYRDVAKKSDILKDEIITEDQSAEILDQSVSLMEGFRDAVKVAIREDQYNKHLKAIEDDIPFIAWLAILKEIIEAYGSYFQDVTSTDGEL